MLVELARIREAPCSFDIDFSADYMNETLEPDLRLGPAGGEAKFSLAGRDVLARGCIRSTLCAPCARCLEEACVPLEAEIDIVFRRRRSEEGMRPEPDEIDLDAPDFAWFTGDEFEPDDDLRELLLLEIPDVIVCDESCRGLCPHCGANLNNETCTCGGSASDNKPLPNTWQAEIRKLRGGGDRTGS